MTARGAKDIKSLIRPLSVGYASPGRQDLAKFWIRVERSLPGLCSGLSFGLLRRSHLEALGPHILGETVWDRIVDESFDSWEEFKRVVQEDYGLTGGEIRRGFTALTKGASEPDEAFVLRVEDERKKGKHSREYCYDVFVPRMSRAF